MIRYREPLDEDAKLILAWRLSPRIKNMMLTSFSYDLEKQIAWLQNSRSRPDYYHWIFQKDNLDIGLLSIWLWPDDYEAMNIGIYAGEAKHSFICFSVLQTIYTYIFNILNKKSVRIQIYEKNPVIKLQEYFGFKRKQPYDLTVKDQERNKYFFGYELTKENFKHFQKNLPNLPYELRQDKANFYLPGSLDEDLKKSC